RPYVDLTGLRASAAPRTSRRLPPVVPVPLELATAHRYHARAPAGLDVLVPLGLPGDLTDVPPQAAGHLAQPVRHRSPPTVGPAPLPAISPRSVSQRRTASFS